MKIGDMLRYATTLLGKDKGLEAQMLLAFVVCKSRAMLLAYTNEELSVDEYDLCMELLEKRKNGVPLQYLTHSANFYGRDFYVCENVLIPRFDTEVLLEKAMQYVREDDCVVDICTGSGILAVSLALEKNCETWAVDLSAKALKVAKKNADNLKAKVNFLEGDLLYPLREKGFKDKFKVIVSNPPYITSEEMLSLAQEVKNEPTMALWGGKDGLYFYRKLSNEAQCFLQSGGYLLLEIGYLQGEDVKNLLISNGFVDVCVYKDFNGLDRVVQGRKK